MARQERPLDPGDGPLQRFAWGLRKVRVEAGGPTYRALARTAGYSASTLSDAAARVGRESGPGEDRHPGLLHSGRVIDILGPNAEGLADNTEVRGAYTLTAADRAAHVGDADGCTAFTGQLLELIRAGVAGGPPVLTFADLYPHLRRRLVGSNLPAPNQRGTDTAEHYPVTHNRAARSSTTDGPANTDPPTPDQPSDTADERAATRPGKRLALPLAGSAASAMSDTPGALQLRLLQTVVDVAAEKNSTLVMPFPVELLPFFERATEPVRTHSRPPMPATVSAKPSKPSTKGGQSRARSADSAV